MLRFANVRFLLLIALGLAISAIGVALFSEMVLGFVPCKLCLEQRIPYYVGFPVFLGALLTAEKRMTFFFCILSSLLLTLFVGGMLLGGYHAGVEWGWWEGPMTCAGTAITFPETASEFFNSLKDPAFIRCDEAAVRILGLSFAGWNAVVSLAIALIVLIALVRYLYCRIDSAD